MFAKAGQIVAALMISAQMASACDVPSRASAMEAEMLAWINAQRQANGLNSLQMNAKLDRAAQGHACDMASRGYFGHQRAGGPDLPARVRGEGYRYRTTAENIAKVGGPEVGRAATVWRNSPGHWDNILNRRVNEIGLGLATTNGNYYWVINMGRHK